MALVAVPVPAKTSTARGRARTRSRGLTALFTFVLLLPLLITFRVLAHFPNQPMERSFDPTTLASNDIHFHSGAEPGQAARVETTFSGPVTHTIPKDMRQLDKWPITYCPAAKAGTTTIHEVLKLKRCPHCPFGRRKTCKFKKFCGAAVWNHPQRNLIMNRTISFTHVRNPWDRIRSAYVDKFNQTNHYLEHVPSERILSFAEFVAYIEKYPDENVHWISFSSRCLTSPNKHGQVFDYDYILRAEYDVLRGLEKLFQRANATLLVKERGMKNRHTNHSLQARFDFYKKAATVSVSMEDLVEAVGRIYKQDVDRFNYSFDRYA